MIAGTKIKLTLFGIFVLGLLVGVAADRFYRLQTEGPTPAHGSGRDSGQTRAIDMLTQRLSLRTDQISKIDVILKEAGEEYLKLRATIRPQLDEVRNRQRDQIRAILDPGQQDIYVSMIQEWDQNRRASERR